MLASMQFSIGRITQIVIIAGLLLVSGSAGSADVIPSGRFVDDDFSPHEGNIEAIAAAGITFGCNPPANNHYCPNDPVTRGEMAAFLVRALGFTDDGGGDWFSDDDSLVFEESIDKLAAAGITFGCNPPANNRYCPSLAITRGQMATFLTRGFLLPPADPAQPYGSAIAADSLGNLPVEGDNQVATRFLAPFDGSLEAFRVYVKWDTDRPGYHAGNGGSLRFELRTDNGSSAHRPSSTVLASLYVPEAIPDPDDSRTGFRLLAFESPVPLEGGKLYHLVIKNASQDPWSNWVSINNLELWNSEESQPVVDLQNWGVLWDRGDGWFDRTNQVPILELSFSGGETKGVGYMAAGSSHSDNSNTMRAFGGSHRVGEIFAPSDKDRVVRAVWLRVVKSHGTGSVLAAVTNELGSTIAHGELASDAIDSSNLQWVRIPLANEATLREGVQYRLEFSAESGTEYRTGIIRDGNLARGGQYGFTENSVFGDGHAERDPGTGWQNWYFIDSSPEDADLQFFFEVASDG